MIGTTLSHYRIVEMVGEGGMGVVYRALDKRLDRTVAVKLLRPEAVGDSERKWRFVREAKAASALNHPNIVTIHDIDADQGVDFIVMEFVEGTPLDRLIPRGGLSVADVVRTGSQIASALGAAHSAGIVHRDVKPANVIVGAEGRVKVLDFGLAKLVERERGGGGATSDSTATAASVVERTRQGVILGTVAYMSPEQAEGRPVDARSDVFSLGAVLYEMLVGRRPFEGDSYLQTLTAILRDAPPPLATLRPDVPAALAKAVTRALEKRPDDRFASAREMETELSALSGSASAAGPPRRSFFRRPAILVPALLLVLAAGGAVLRMARDARVRHAREVTLPEIPKLLDQQKVGAAIRLARKAERIVPADVARLRKETWFRFSIRSEPPGADVFFRPYLEVDAEWEPVGKTPIEEIRLPLAYYRWKFTRSGFQTVEATATTEPIRIRLDPESAVPAGMVRVPGGSFALRSLDAVALDDFWLDKYEVTNREFKAFVDAGGYAKREYWKQPFVRGGREIPFEEALAAFRDATGRPGPATWELGSFPEGRADYPVEGVSWYEAAAYAEFAGKSLPTIYHWYRAAGQGLFSEILSLSNFSGKGAAPGGTYQGLAPFGNYDMAGNVKEWCWNENGARRYILGGSSTEVIYMFQEADAQDPFLRAAGYGFRCARYVSPPAAAVFAPVGTISRDYSKEKPVTDEVFRVYRSLYAYDKTPLDVKSEGADDSSEYWRREKVSVLSAYGNERVPVLLFLPKNARPPYQTVVYFPSSQARIMRSTADLDLRLIDFIIRSGRALCYPVYRDTYERHVERTASGPNFRRDLDIQWSKDLGRALDWLETRPDVDKSRLAFYGVSLGAIDGIPLIAVDNRFRSAVLLAGGFRLVHVPPEIEPINFASRVRIPVLLIGGRYDFQHPLETAQRPLFRMLGTPEREKKHVVFEGGHIPPRLQPIIKEILDWLDRTLGPVPQSG
jgi:formylglycine-generating enzyme required for sulfatase activity/pimeloyl-ACP methyl ester carboxylesterase/predicted Ser/Thr protein kinase